MPDFDFDAIGFEIAEIEALLNEANPKEVTEDAVEEPERKAPPVMRKGDIPPAEAEEQYYAVLDDVFMAA